MLPDVPRETPLHVQVAEALGWSNLHERTEGHWWGKDPYGGMSLAVPIYDRSWCSIGVLCDRFVSSLSVILAAPDSGREDIWEATSHLNEVSQGKTACEAIARLVVRLHDKGNGQGT